MVKWTDYIEAAKNLSPSALNLYMYLAKNQDDYNLWFSSKDYCQTFDVVDRTYRNARSELLKKGYLKEGDDNKVYFDAAGGYKETKENLKEKLTKIGDILSLKSQSSYNELYKEIVKANLREIKDENLYIINIKKLISYGEDLIKEVSATEINNLL